MTTLLNMWLVNAVVVVPLAGVVWGVSRWARNPALTHVLWVLVLLKLVTPPFFRLPYSISIPGASQVTIVSKAALSLEPLATISDTTSVTCSDQFLNSAVSSGDDQDQSISGASAAGVCKSPAVISAPKPTSAFQPGAWLHGATKLGRTFVSWFMFHPYVVGVLLGVWCVGIVVWFGHQALWAVRFWRGIEPGSSIDPNMQRQARQLADRFGLRGCPQVVLVEAQLSPMLWGYGSRLRLLFPADLARRLDHDARGTLMAHELAHYSRGDHWIRVLELLVTGVFWWHPVVWLARRLIEESEEECCDAWVVTELPHTPRRYAEALLDTIDFLCDAPTALPPLASGLGPAAFLRRRLTRIMQGVSSKELSPRQRYGVFLIALLALPLQPFVLGSNSAARSANLVEVPTLVRSTAASSTAVDMEPVEHTVTPDANPLPEPPPAPDRPMPASPRPSRSARGERIWGTAVSSNGRFAVDKTTARRMLLTNLATNEQSDLSHEDLTSVAFFPDGDSFAAGGSDGRVTSWSASTGAMMRTLYTHDDVVRSVAVSPHGDVVAIGGRDGSVHLIDVVTSRVIAELPRRESAVNCVRFSPDGHRLAVAIGDWNSNDPGQVLIWNLESGGADSVLPCESAPGAVSFASNDELIVGQWNGQTSLWNLVNHRIVGSGLADKNIVNEASFSPDNGRLYEVVFVPTNRLGDRATTEF